MAQADLAAAIVGDVEAAAADEGKLFEVGNESEQRDRTLLELASHDQLFESYKGDLFVDAAGIELDSLLGDEDEEA